MMMMSAKKKSYPKTVHILQVDQLPQFHSTVVSAQAFFEDNRHPISHCKSCKNFRHGCQRRYIVPKQPCWSCKAEYARLFRWTPHILSTISCFFAFFTPLMDSWLQIDLNCFDDNIPHGFPKIPVGFLPSSSPPVTSAHVMSPKLTVVVVTGTVTGRAGVASSSAAASPARAAAGREEGRLEGGVVMVEERVEK